MSVVIERVRLYHREGRSDKLYEIELIAEGDGRFHVVGYNGRRGAQLVAQPKTQRGVPFVTARRIFDQLVHAKLNHRRTPYQFDGRETFDHAPAQSAVTPAKQDAPPQAAAGYRAGHLDALEL